MASFNKIALELSSEEMNVLQVAVDHIVEDLTYLHTHDPSDRYSHRQLDAANRLKKWFKGP